MKNDLNMSDLNMSHEKISDLVSLPLFGLTVVIKLRNFDFGSHWNTLMHFDKTKMLSDLNMFHGKISHFVSFPLFRFTLVIKLTNFNFENHWNTLIFFDKKICQIWFCPGKQCLICFILSCLSINLAKSLKMRILNFIKIV